MTETTSGQALGYIAIGLVVFFVLGIATSWRRSELYAVTGLLVVGYGVYALIRARLDGR